MFVNVEMFDIQKCALPLLFGDFDFFANLQGRFGRFVNLALWCLKMANQRILFLSDNEATTYAVNKMSSKDHIMMKLVRRLVVATMKFYTFSVVRKKQTT